MASSRVSISATPWVSGKHQHKQPAKTQKNPNNNGGNQGTEFLPTENNFKSILEIKKKDFLKFIVTKMQKIFAKSLGSSQF